MVNLIFDSCKIHNIFPISKLIWICLFCRKQRNDLFQLPSGYTERWNWPTINFTLSHVEKQDSEMPKTKPRSFLSDLWTITIGKSQRLYIIDRTRWGRRFRDRMEPTDSGKGFYTKSLQFHVKNFGNWIIGVSIEFQIWLFSLFSYISFIHHPVDLHPILG